MKSYLIRAEKFFLPAGCMDNGYLEVVDGKFGQWHKQIPLECNLEVVDMGDRWIAPGFVDTHIHGFKDHDVMDKDPQGILDASIGLAKAGTTTWLPTTLTASVEDTCLACESVAKSEQMRPDHFKGARVGGVFLEGPFFTEKHKGAQNPAYMMDPSTDIFNEWQQASEGLIKKSAIAPEREHSEEYATYLKEHGVVCALGHSDATFDEGMAALNAGASVFVHTYNGMSGLHHREPGLVGLAMVVRNSYAELICDGIHVNKNACKALIEAKGYEHVALISDCLRCGGMPEGDYMLGDFPIIMQDGICRLKNGESIAGSVITMAQAVQNVFQWELVTASQAIEMGTAIPSRANNIDDVCGSILPGRHADFVVLDNQLNLISTYMDGELV